MNDGDHRSHRYNTCHDDFGILTPMEVKVIERLTKDGCSNKVIAAEFYLAEKSVKWHISNMMAFAKVTNRTALALWWIRGGREKQDRLKEYHDRRIT